MLRAAAAHKGAAFVEVYQNCNVYNDGAFDFVREDKENRIRLEHGQPIRFGAEDEKGVRLRVDGSAEIVDVAEAGEEALLVHDAHADEPSIAFALSRLTRDTVGAAPIGVFRAVERPVYDELLAGADRRRDGEVGDGRSRRPAPLRRHLDDRLKNPSEP